MNNDSWRSLEWPPIFFAGFDEHLTMSAFCARIVVTEKERMFPFVKTEDQDETDEFKRVWFDEFKRV